MRTYLLAIIAGLTLSALLWLGLFFIQLGAPTAGSSRWIYECSLVKEKAAKEKNGPRCLLVAGSNVLFGISAAEIEKSLKIPTVNLSTHAGLGVEYILNYAKKHSRSGDIVVLPLEYTFYLYAGKRSAIALDYIISRDVDYFRSMELLEKIETMYSISPWRMLQGLKAKLNLSSMPSRYSAATLNSHGDETNNKKENMRKRYINSHTFDNWVGKINPEDRSWKLLFEFSTWCKQNNVLLLATFPSYIYFDEYMKPESKAFFDYIVNYYNSIDVKMLGSPADFMYSKDMFYDTKYHLNDVGNKERTEQIITFLQPYVETQMQKPGMR